MRQIAAQTPVDRYLTKTLNALAVLLKTVLFVPFLEILLLSVTAAAGEPDLAPLFVTLGVLGLIVIVVCSAVLNVFYAPLSPFDSHPLSCFELYPDALKTCVKAIILMFFFFDPNIS